jgi:hypothetical protein
MGESLKVVWAEFSTLSYAVFVMSVFAWHAKACPHLELKTQPSFRPVNAHMSLFIANTVWQPIQLTSKVGGLTALPLKCQKIGIKFVNQPNNQGPYSQHFIFFVTYEFAQ